MNTCTGTILTLDDTFGWEMDKKHTNSHSLAAAITNTASKQTFYTIRFFVDRNLVPDAYRAYGYFRWVDDVLDAESGSQAAKISFVNRQKSLLESCYQGQNPADLCPEESILADLVHSDTEENSGLQAYLRNMMAVMDFDAARRGRVITQAELAAYSHALAAAVTEAMHYFIGHNCPSVGKSHRYQAVTAAHITHLLRDTLEDVEAGYYNIPREVLQASGISPQDVDHPAYRVWVRGRVKMACRTFQLGRAYLARVKNLRCRLAGYAYAARFEWMLAAIERDNYRLRSAYPERKTVWAGLWMLWRTLASLFASLWIKPGPGELAVQPGRLSEL